jgi:choline dehydrogenase-like flavoprotein
MTTDYIIVGAGSAGCVLAARLSEDPDVRVTLIEAGAPDTAVEIHIPAAFGKLFQSKWDWDYLTDPEPGLDFRRRYLPRGKMLGGSSSKAARRSRRTTNARGTCRRKHPDRLLSPWRAQLERCQLAAPARARGVPEHGRWHRSVERDDRSESSPLLSKVTERAL